MMITYVHGDLFASPAHVLVNTVNTVGVMGKGIAKEFKAIYPEMFRIYREFCERQELTIGNLLLYRTPHKTILNFPTKRDWRQRSRVQDVEAGLKTFASKYSNFSITSVAFPQLGCGNGELDWEREVRPLMEQYLGPLPIDIYIHIYDRGDSILEHHERERIKSWLRSEPKSLAFREFWEDVVGEVRALCEVDDWTAVVETEGVQKALGFIRDSKSFKIAEDDLLDIWQRFRSFGLLSADDLPLPFQVVSEPFFDLLCRLEYVERAHFASLTRLTQANEVSTIQVLRREQSRGLRLAPPADPVDLQVQLTFFEEANVA